VLDVDRVVFGRRATGDRRGELRALLRSAPKLRAQRRIDRDASRALELGDGSGSTRVTHVVPPLERIAS
jgi:hypothetical protein